MESTKSARVDHHLVKAESALFGEAFARVLALVIARVAAKPARKRLEVRPHLTRCQRSGDARVESARQVGPMKQANPRARWKWTNSSTRFHADFL